MATPPYVEPANVFKQYQALGESASGVVKSIGMTMDEYKKEKNDASTIGQWVDSLKSVGIDENRMPGEDVESFKKRAAGKWMVFKTISDWKAKVPELMSIDPNTATKDILTIEQGEKRAKTLAEQFQKKALQQTEQKGIAAQKGLAPKATQAERAGAFSEATGGEEPGKLGQLAIEGGEKQMSPWQTASLGVSREDKATQQVQAANNSIVNTKAKKDALWKDVEAEKTKIEADMMMEPSEKHDKIMSLVQDAHGKDESYDNEIGTNSAIIYGNLKQFPHLFGQLSEDVTKDYEKYLKQRIKKTKDKYQKKEGLAPGLSPAPAAAPAPAPAPATNKFEAGKSYKDASGNVAIFLGGDPKDPNSWK